jgi:hypothetical protein
MGRISLPYFPVNFLVTVIIDYKDWIDENM